jgi:hypothetical protein
MGSKCTVRVVLRNGVHVGGVTRGDRVALHIQLWRESPTIVNASRRHSALFNAISSASTNIRQTLFLTSTMLSRKCLCWEGHSQVRSGRKASMSTGKPRKARLGSYLRSAHHMTSSIPSPDHHCCHARFWRALFCKTNNDAHEMCSSRQRVARGNCISSGAMRRVWRRYTACAFYDGRGATSPAFVPAVKFHSQFE